MVTPKLIKLFSTIMKDEGNERTNQTTVGKRQELCADLLFSKAMVRQHTYYRSEWAARDLNHGRCRLKNLFFKKWSSRVKNNSLKGLVKKCHVSAVSHWSAARNGLESESDSDGSEIPIPERPPFFKGEAEHEKITKKGYVYTANNHRQKKAACSEPTLSHIYSSKCRAEPGAEPSWAVATLGLITFLAAWTLAADAAINLCICLCLVCVLWPLCNISCQVGSVQAAFSGPIVYLFAAHK